jgi:RnfABCDGE-type electron transport complex G subunit
MIIVLTTVGLVSGGFLAGVGILTQERIEWNKQQEIERAIIECVPGTNNNLVLLEEEELVVYQAQDEQASLIGYAVLASGTGFQDKITLMFGADPSLTRINRLVILEQKETPGLGAKITSEEAYLRFWKDRDISQTLALHKPAVDSPDDLSPNEVNTITGATISSEKILKIVNLSVERLKMIISQESKRSAGEDG